MEILNDALRGGLLAVIYFIPVNLICMMWLWMNRREWITTTLAHFLSILTFVVWLAFAYRIWQAILSK